MASLLPFPRTKGHLNDSLQASISVENPEHILFVQHGWADNCSKVERLAQSVAGSNTVIVAPSLGYINTWIRIRPLIEKVERIFLEKLEQYPHATARIVGHSMGGLIWLEVLHRHPELWSRVNSVVLVASPVGGADLARIIDPFELGIGIARDLGKNRRAIAEEIAANIPTLVIAGDIDHGSDGTITVACTRVHGTKFICLPDLEHAILSHHTAVASSIQQFWAEADSLEPTTDEEALIETLIHRLHQVPGFTDGHYRDFRWAHRYLEFDYGITLRTWRNPIGIQHVFIACAQGRCHHAGFVGWQHDRTLTEALESLKQEFQAALVVH